MSRTHAHPGPMAAVGILTTLLLVIEVAVVEATLAEAINGSGLLPGAQISYRVTAGAAQPSSQILK